MEGGGVVWGKFGGYDGCDGRADLGGEVAVDIYDTTSVLPKF